MSGAVGSLSREALVGLVAEALSTPECRALVRSGGGDRFSHAYCDVLPRDHSGPHDDLPGPDRLNKAWAELVVDALESI